MIKGLIHQEDIIIINLLVPNNAVANVIHKVKIDKTREMSMSLTMRDFDV